MNEADPLPTPPAPAPAPMPTTTPLPSPLPPAAAFQPAVPPWMFPPGVAPGGGYPIPYLPVAPLAPPRVWSAFVVPLVAVVVGAVLGGVAVLVALIAELGPQALTDEPRMMDWLQSYGATPGGLLVLLLPGQLAFLAAALAAAWLSPVPLRRRLGLLRPTAPLWLLPLLLPATWFAGMCGDLLMYPLFDEPSEHLKLLENLIRGPSGALLVLVTFVISVPPGFAEEFLFRGYAQRRLLARWHPAAAFGVSSLMFAAAHVDPAHVVGVLPMGVWFGVVAWLSGSVWPGVLCHVANNAAAALITNALLDTTETTRFDAPHLTMLAITGAFMAASLWVMWAYRAPAGREAPHALPPAVSPPQP